jgi:hypothetical protein
MYISIVKGLQAEYGALVDLDPDTAAYVTPLIQLWARTPKEENSADEPDDSNDQEVAEEAQPGQQPMWDEGVVGIVWGRLNRQLLAKVKRKWPADRPVILDGEWLEDPEAYGTILVNCRTLRRRPLPVTGLTRDDAYQAVVANSVAIDAGGLVLRLGRDDFRSSAIETLTERIDSFLSRFGLQPAEVDVILDLRFVGFLHRERDEVFAESMIRSLPHLKAWRNLALVGSGMPRDGKGFRTNDITPFGRSEWWVWLELRRRIAALGLGRLPIFGDYGVINPEPEVPTGDSRPLSRIPQVRYTAGDDCLMIRGLDLRETDPAHLQPLFQQLIDGRDWSGASFSKGDAWIARVAAGSPNPGIWSTWKRNGQSHHWTYVSQQLATRFGL